MKKRFMIMGGPTHVVVGGPLASAAFCVVFRVVVGAVVGAPPAPAATPAAPPVRVELWSCVKFSTCTENGPDLQSLRHFVSRCIGRKRYDDCVAVLQRNVRRCCKTKDEPAEGKILTAHCL